MLCRWLTILLKERSSSTVQTHRAVRSSPNVPRHSASPGRTITIGYSRPTIIADRRGVSHTVRASASHEMFPNFFRAISRRNAVRSFDPGSIGRPYRDGGWAILSHRRRFETAVYDVHVSPRGRVGYQQVSLA